MFITLCVGIGKFVFGIVFKNPMFGVSGVFSVFMCLSKVECYLGAKTSRKTFKSRNNMIAIFLLIASLVYIFYSARLVFMDFSSMSYPDFAAIIIAAVSFIELGIAIYGLAKVKRKGHYFRNIKIINFFKFFILEIFFFRTVTDKCRNHKQYNGYYGKNQRNHVSNWRIGRIGDIKTSLW